RDGRTGLSGENTGTGNAQHSADRHDRGNRDEHGDDAPEGELTPHAAAVDYGVSIERHHAAPVRSVVLGITVGCDRDERAAKNVNRTSAILGTSINSTQSCVLSSSFSYAL